MGMAERIAAAYALATGTRIEIIPGLGSSGSIKATGDGAIELAIASRPLKPAEAALGLTQVLFARTPMVFVTSHPRPPGLPSADIPGIFAATDPEWPDGSPINIILRTASDTDVAIAEQSFPGLAEALEVARQRPEIPVTATDQDNATAAEELPGSFVQSGLSQMVTEKRNLRMVTLDGVEPTPENLESGAYPYEKPFYLVYAAKTAEAAEGLLHFLRSEQGRAILRDSGCLPVTE
jgi:phosphate transport system substrate-binding protein